MSREPELALVLHTHMPYVEGFGTWPFGEEWLWEAWATSYVPLCDVLDAHPGRLTLSVTPVLADQLAAPGVPERYLAFLRDVREASHALDIEAHPEVRAQLEHSLERYRWAAEPDLLGRFAEHATWTSSATHAILPLLATEAGIELQVRTGVDSFRQRFGRDAEGFWLGGDAGDRGVAERGEESRTIIELRRTQDMVVAEVKRAQARVQSAASARRCQL